MGLAPAADLQMCIRDSPPSTPDGISRIRLTAHADHDDLHHATTVLRAITGG